MATKWGSNIQASKKKGVGVKRGGGSLHQLIALILKLLSNISSTNRIFIIIYRRNAMHLSQK